MSLALPSRIRVFALFGITTCLLLAILFAWKPWLVQTYHNRTRQFLEVRKNEEALSPLRAALRLIPDHAETHLLFARTFRRLGYFEKANAFLRIANNFDAMPDQVEREAWLVLAQAGHLRKAEPHLSGLLTDSRGDGVDICEAFVQGYITNFQFEKAHQLLDVWHKQYPLDSMPYFLRGNLLYEFDKLSESIAEYREGLTLNPENKLMRIRLAELLVEQREFTQAQQLLRQCKTESPHNPKVLLAKAKCLSERDSMEAAEQILDNLLTEYPNLFQAHRLLGEIKNSQRQYNLAASHLQAALLRRPYDITTNKALGKALQMMGKENEAQQHLKYVAEAEPHLSRTKRQLQQVIDEPNNVELRYEIGKTLLKYGNPQEAARWIRSALELQPDHKAARRTLSLYLEMKKDRYLD